MKLENSLEPPAGLGAGRRFFLVGYLPTYAALLFLLSFVWAGARGWQEPEGGGLAFAQAWKTAADLKAGEVLGIVLAVTVAALLLQPLQLGMVRFLEGNWPAPLGRDLAVKRQLARRQRWKDAAADLPQDPAALTDEAVQRAGLAGAELRRRYPVPNHLVRATALGNALAAAEDSAGRAYGMDAVVSWPRLYAVLGDRTRAVVDDQRDRLDGSARMAVTMAVTAVASAVLLVRTGWWLLLALIPVVVAAAAYHGAVQTARAYGESVHVAFDLHRFDLLTALRVPRPATHGDEVAKHAQLNDLWRQGVPLPASFEYLDDESTAGPVGNGGQP